LETELISIFDFYFGNEIKRENSNNCVTVLLCVYPSNGTISISTASTWQRNYNARRRLQCVDRTSSRDKKWV